MTRRFQSILITGASSGIGAALAEAYAAPGVSLFLCGRDPARLEEIRDICLAAGAARVEVQALDVTDRRAMEEWVIRADSDHPLDLVIANAGVSGDTSGGEDTPERDRLVRKVKVNGVLNTVDPLVPRMAARGRGQIAIMSSLASFRGMPGAPQYAAANAWARSYGEGLRGRLAADGIGVSVICPGFVVSRITDENRFHMPMLMDAPKAARIIRRGIARNRPRIAFPWIFHAMLVLTAALPPGLTDRFFAGLPRKE